MKRFLLSGLFLGMLAVMNTSVSAQSAFWTFDENNQAAIIPPQCDGRFDEERGGVFLPSPEDLFLYGEALLVDKSDKRLGAGYCLTAAALQGHVEAQYRLAQLYNKGIVLPQNDLIAYKWAFIASMNGHEPASRLALLLEQFLTTEEIELATASVQDMLPDLLAKKKNALEYQQALVDEKIIALEEINAEIDALLGIRFESDVLPGQQMLREREELERAEEENDPSAVPSLDSIFSEEDKMQ